MYKLLFVLSIVLTSYLPQSILGQNIGTKPTFKRDVSPTITKSEFDCLVDETIYFLESNTLEQATDKEHTSMIMCINTVFFKYKKEERYRILKVTFTQVQNEYVAFITTHYPDFTYNRGMGFYFPSLKMELLGTPFQYAMFNVDELNK